MTVVDTETLDTAPGDDDRWRRAVGVGLAAYVVSRLCVLVGAAVRASQLTIDARADNEPEEGAVSLITSVLTSWDGRWYLELVREWYPTEIPPSVTYDDLEARAAFFPMYPGAVRVIDTFLPGGDTFAALFLNFVLGGLAVVMVGMMARRVFSISVAARSMVIFSFFPGSFVLSFAYSEALLIVFAAACLLLLVDEQWLLAGLAAALATATRPNGIAVVAACVVAAAIAIRTRRQWSSLISVLLAPIGFIGFQLYVDDTAGESRAWFRVQREAWAEGTSFGTTAIRNTFTFITDPFESPAGALTALSLVALGGMCWCAWKRRLPLPWIAYSAVVIALMLIPETVTARPRFVFTAFPLFIAVAAWWPDPSDDPDHHRASWDRSGWDFTLVMCGAGLTGLTGLYAVFGAIP
ncbi:MAG: glycosyltransferase family 39 protein [Ilumatobacter sp.]|jgi:4-amino-4-deoxy-L-arabinose transferase-like glycosyltransferase|uniref:glycosyltransferase family 39 protein n=1 Tax=Ilumatobacter sp. TaxID=1967498 RepID=UPI00391D243C